MTIRYACPPPRGSAERPPRGEAICIVQYPLYVITAVFKAQLYHYFPAFIQKDPVGYIKSSKTGAIFEQVSPTIV